MKEVLQRMQQVHHLCPQCISCAFNKYSTKFPEDCLEDQKVLYMQRVMEMMSQAKLTTAIPVLVRDIDQLRIQMFGFTDDFTEIKKHFNGILLEKIDDFRERISQADDPLKLAMQLALVGNYIDFGVAPEIDETFLHELIEEAEKKDFGEASYRQLRKDLEKGGLLVYLTDNCGEIVMDRLVIEQIKKEYPDLKISVVVRGQDTMNDATMEDAIQIGMDQMDEIEEIAGNGNNIMGTWFPEISQEAAALIKKGDVMIAKGQANFETMRLCGLNVYYLFLCKCDLYADMFHVPKLSGILINDHDPRNQP